MNEKFAQEKKKKKTNTCQFSTRTRSDNCFLFLNRRTNLFLFKTTIKKKKTLQIDSAPSTQLSLAIKYRTVEQSAVSCLCIVCQGKVEKYYIKYKCWVIKQWPCQSVHAESSFCSQLPKIIAVLLLHCLSSLYLVSRTFHPFYHPLLIDK